MSVRSRVGAAVVVGLAAAVLAVPATRGQDKAPAAKPTQFPEPTQFDPRPFQVKLDDDALAVAYSPDGTLVAIGCADKTVRLCDPATAKILGTLAGHTDAVSPDGKLVATAGSDRRAILWNVADWSIAGSLRGHGAPLRAVAFSPDGALLVTGSEDNTARVWDVAKKETKYAAMLGHTDTVT